jgi:hypothetical protein
MRCQPAWKQTGAGAQDRSHANATLQCQRRHLWRLGDGSGRPGRLGAAARRRGGTSPLHGRERSLSSSSRCRVSDILSLFMAVNTVGPAVYLLCKWGLYRTFQHETVHQVTGASHSLCDHRHISRLQNKLQPLTFTKQHHRHLLKKFSSGRHRVCRPPRVYENWRSCGAIDGANRRRNTATPTNAAAGRQC